VSEGTYVKDFLDSWTQLILPAMRWQMRRNETVEECRYLAKYTYDVNNM
jgi:hypothetical protein